VTEAAPPELRRYAFVHRGKPLSFKKVSEGRKALYRSQLQPLYRRAGGTRLDGLLYGIVLYIRLGYSPTNDADADNISKPVWDVLEGEAYDDDKSIRLRLAGVADVKPASAEVTLEAVPLGEMPDQAAEEVIAAIGDGVPHILYVEVGQVQQVAFPLAAIRGAQDAN